MRHILHIEASPRGDLSTSTRVAKDFLEAVQAAAGPVPVIRRNLWETELPEFSGDAIGAKYARLRGEELTQAQQQAWDEIARLVGQLDAASALLISTPMWNLGLPYRLKHWFDLVTQPGLSFRFRPSEGYFPLLRSRPVIVILASSGDFSSGLSYDRPDLASGYLTAALGFLGLTSPAIVAVGPTAGTEEAIRAGDKSAARRLQSLAPDFARVFQ